MEQITLRPMTRTMCHALYRDWQNDPAIYADPAKCPPYQYDPAWVDRYFDSKQEPNRLFLAILLGERVIGEIHLKRIDREKGQCTVGIHLQNNAVKGHGYGVQATRLAIDHAFHSLGLHTVLADALITNARSQHVLEKLGFQFVEERGGFRYYQLDR